MPLDTPDWILDERPLREHIADIDLNSAEYLSDECGLLVGVTDYAIAARRSFLGLEPSTLYSGRCILYSCSKCGDPFEGVLSVRVEYNADTVRWFDFVIEYEDAWIERKTGIEHPATESTHFPGLEFTFNRVAYDTVLAASVQG